MSQSSVYDFIELAKATGSRYETTLRADQLNKMGGKCKEGKFFRDGKYVVFKRKKVVYE